MLRLDVAIGQTGQRGGGTYTDDTQMMIALAESLIERGRVDDQHLACAFTEAYEPDRGYDGGTQRVSSCGRTGRQSLWPPLRSSTARATTRSPRARTTQSFRLATLPPGRESVGV